MTVAALPVRATYVQTDDEATLYSVPFQYIADAQILCVSIDAAGDETALSSSSFVVSGDGRASTPTGKVRLLEPEEGDTLEIRRSTAIVQDTAYTDREDFPHASHQDAMDRVYMAVQEQSAEGALSLRVKRGQNVASIDLGDYAGKAIGVSAGADALVPLSLNDSDGLDTLASLADPEAGAALISYRETDVEHALARMGPNIEDWTSGTTYEKLVAAFAQAAGEDFGAVLMGPKGFAIDSAELLASGAIVRPKDVDLIGCGRLATSLTVTGSAVINYLFNFNNSARALTRGIRFVGNQQKDDAFPYAGALASVICTGAANEDLVDVVFEDCDIDGFRSAAVLFIENQTLTRTIYRCGSKGCNWVSRARLPKHLYITVPGHFVYFSGSTGAIRDLILHDGIMDAYYMKGGAAFVGNCQRGDMSIEVLRNCGQDINDADPTGSLATAANGANDGPGAYSTLFYKTAAGVPSKLTLRIGDLDNIHSVGVYGAEATDLDLYIDRASGQRDTRDGTLPKGVFAFSGCANINARLGRSTDNQRVCHISLDGGVNRGTDVENADINVELGISDSRSGATDVKIEIGATSWGGGVTIKGRRSGAAQFGVDVRGTAAFGLQDLDFSDFISAGAQYGERWGAATNVKLRRITSSRDVSATDNDILGVGTGSTATVDLLISDPSVTNDSLPGYAGVQRLGGQSQALTDAATITPDFGGPRAGGGNFHVTLGGNRTLANPTNLFAGQKGRIRVTQDGTGTRTLAYGNAWKFPGGAPTLSTAAGSVDVINFYVHSGSLIEASIGKALA